MEVWSQIGEKKKKQRKTWYKKKEEKRDGEERQREKERSLEQGRKSVNRHGTIKRAKNGQ